MIQKKKTTHDMFLIMLQIFKVLQKNGLNCYCDVIKDYEIFIKFESKLISNTNNVFVNYKSSIVNEF